MKQTTDPVEAALRSIENAERGPLHPRTLARKAIAEWKSNAQRDGLPLVNRRAGKGAEVLDVDAVLRRSEANHIGRR